MNTQNNPANDLIQITANKGELYITVSVDGRLVLHLGDEEAKTIADVLAARAEKREFSAVLYGGRP